MRVRRKEILASGHWALPGLLVWVVIRTHSGCGRSDFIFLNMQEFLRSFETQLLEKAREQKTSSWRSWCPNRYSAGKLKFYKMKIHSSTNWMNILKRYLESLIKQNICTPYGPEILLLGLFLRDTHLFVLSKVCVRVYIAAYCQK